MTELYKHGAILLIALFLLTSTTFTSVYVESASKLKDVRFGFPLAFISQDKSDLATKASFPANVNFNTDKFVKESKSTKLLELEFLVDLIIILSILEGIYLGSERIYKK